MKENVLEELISAVEEQISTNNPKETKITYQKLIHNGDTPRQAKEKIAHIIYIESIAIIKTQQPFNRNRYIRNLERLVDGEFPIM
jgi:hypothetical protein